MARMARAPGPALPAWLRRLAWSVLGAALGLAALLTWRTAILAPYADALDWAERWVRLQGDGDWLGFLLAPHNANRMGWTTALVALDLAALKGTSLPLLLSGALGLGALAALLARETARAAPAPLPAPAAALAVLLVLSPPNLLNASTPINATYVHATLLAAVAILLAEGASRAGVSWRRAGAVLAAAGAGLGSGVGLAVWPALALGALRRREWSWLALVGLGALAFVGLYATGQSAAPGGAAAGLDLRTAIGTALTFLMLPWSRLATDHAWMGGLVVAAAAIAAVAGFGGRYAARHERVAASLIVFSLVAAAMAGLGRSGGPQPLDVPIRYGLLVTPLHIGLLMLALPYAGVLWRANRGLAHGLAAAVLVLALAQNLLMAAPAVRVNDAVKQTLADFRAGRRTPLTAVFVHPDHAFAERTYSDLERRGLYRRVLPLKPAARSR